MRQRASPTRPPEGQGPGGSPQGGALALSGGELQGFPTVRRVIGERSEATLWSRNERAGTVGAPKGHHRPAKGGLTASGTPLGIALSWDTLI
jgi:hypothetical protein